MPSTLPSASAEKPSKLEIFLKAQMYHWNKKMTLCQTMIDLQQELLDNLSEMQDLEKMPSSAQRNQAICSLLNACKEIMHDFYVYGECVVHGTTS